MTNVARPDDQKRDDGNQKSVHQESTQNKMLKPKADKALRAPETKG